MVAALEIFDKIRGYNLSEQSLDPEFAYLQKKVDELKKKFGITDQVFVRQGPSWSASKQSDNVFIIQFSPSEARQFSVEKQTAILGHELAHVKFRHRDKIDSYYSKTYGFALEILDQAYIVGLGWAVILGSKHIHSLISKNVELIDQSSLISRIGIEKFLIGSAAFLVTCKVIQGLTHLPLRRQNEMEADKEALKHMSIREKESYIEFFESARKSGVLHWLNDRFDWFFNHPSTLKRIAVVQASIEEDKKPIYLRVAQRLSRLFSIA